MLAERTRMASKKPQTVKGFIDSMDPAFIQCRDARHHWQLHGGGKLPGPRGGWERGWRCINCGGTKTDYLDYKGRLVVGGRRRTYPDGYLAKGIGRFDADAMGQVRLAHMQETLGARHLKVVGS